MATAAANTPEQSQWSLPSIDKLPPRPGHGRSSPTENGQSAGTDRLTGTRSGKSGSRYRNRARERSGGTTSDNRWTASEIAAFFGMDPNRTPSLNSGSTAFPSSRFGESYASKSAGSRATSSKSFMTELMGPREDDMVGLPGGLLGTARSAWSSAHFHYDPDYEQKKQRVLKGKFSKQLANYFPDVTTKRSVVSEESEDDAYDTDLDPDLGLELLADERASLCKEFGSNPEYKRMCQKYQVVPNNYFLRHIMDEKLQLNYRYLGFGDSYTLAKEIENQPSINSLDLEDNAIGPAGMVCFADMLKKNSYIHEVNLRDNKLGVLGARLLKNVLLKNARLISVDISGNAFGERGAKYLADVIDRNDTIKHLYISHNAIADSGATLIGKALGNNVTLKTLDLSWNHIRKKGAFGLSKGLKTNSTLEVLRLSMNGLHVEGTRLLMNALRGNDSLKELDLSANRMEKEAAKTVARTLPHLLQLTALKLAFNPMSSEGAEQVVKALMNCPISPVRFVDFEGVVLEDSFQLLAEELMQQRQSAGLQLLYRIPPSSRERSLDLPIETLSHLAELLEQHDTDIQQLFNDVSDDDQLILSTEDVFNRAQKSGRVPDPHLLARLKQRCHRDLRRRFLLKELLLLCANRRHSQLDSVRGAQALNTPELREVQNAWRYPRPSSSTTVSSPLTREHTDPDMASAAQDPVDDQSAVSPP